MNESPMFAAETSVRHQWLSVTAVSLATFSVVTTEMLPVGLLTPIADTLDISSGTAGLMISLPALLAALFAPLVVMAAGDIDRRRILCGLLGLLIIANITSALAPSLWWMLAGRVLVGFCMGGHMGYRWWTGCPIGSYSFHRFGNIHHFWRGGSRICDGGAARSMGG